MFCPFRIGRNHDDAAIFASPSGRDGRVRPCRFPACLPWHAAARAQDSPDERRCTGQWRATNEERITSCTALIDSGRYPAAQSRHPASRPRRGDAGQGRHCRRAQRFRRSDQAQSRLCAGIRRPRQRAVDAARPGRRHRRSRHRDQARSKRRRRVHDARQRLRREGRTSTAPSPITTKRSVCRRTMPRRISIAGWRFAARAISTMRSPTTIRRSSSTRRTPRR